MVKVLLGIDPGTRICGFGALEVRSEGPKVIDYGCIRLPVNEELGRRYWILFESFSELVENLTPTEIAVEAQFLHKNFPSSMKLAGAKTVLLLVAAKIGIPLTEYSATKAKKAVTGNGLATKEQVQKALQNRLSLRELPKPEDAADALALAYCHYNALNWRAQCTNT